MITQVWGKNKNNNTGGCTLLCPLSPDQITQRQHRTTGAHCLETKIDITHWRGGDKETGRHTCQLKQHGWQNYTNYTGARYKKEKVESALPAYFPRRVTWLGSLYNLFLCTPDNTGCSVTDPVVTVGDSSVGPAPDAHRQYRRHGHTRGCWRSLDARRTPSYYYYYLSIAARTGGLWRGPLCGLCTVETQWRFLFKNSTDWRSASVPRCAVYSAANTSPKEDIIAVLTLPYWVNRNQVVSLTCSAGCSPPDGTKKSVQEGATIGSSGGLRFFAFSCVAEKSRSYCFRATGNPGAECSKKEKSTTKTQTDSCAVVLGIKGCEAGRRKEAAPGERQFPLLRDFVWNGFCSFC